MLTIKGRRCEHTIDPEKHAGARIDRTEATVDSARDCTFRIPLISNTRGHSRKITAEQAEAAFRRT